MDPPPPLPVADPLRTWRGRGEEVEGRGERALAARILSFSPPGPGGPPRVAPPGMAYSDLMGSGVSYSSAR